MATYWAKLRDPRWQRRRLEILQRDEFECRLCCDDASTLHVHHLRYEKGADPWDAPDSSLLTACESCHEELHAMQFGQRYTEALISGGAGIDVMHWLLDALDSALVSGPNAGFLSWPEWETVISDLEAALSKIQKRPHRNGR